MIKEFDSLYDMTEAFPNEQSCIDHLMAIRWKDGAYCPHCGSEKIYHFKDKRTHKCGGCRQRFSIKVGTIFEDSKLPLRKWFMAIWLITSHKKGIASTTLARDLKTTQKTAWFILHRLRHAAQVRSFNRPLQGDVEVDETFHGGKEKNKHVDKRQKLGRGAVGKTVIWGALERGGEFRAKKIDSLKTVKSEMLANVAPGSNVMTDDYPGYKGLQGIYNHHTIKHSAGDYVKHADNHTNGIEGAWSLIKRQIYGIHYWVSPKHLDRYPSEMTWRYNRRGTEESQLVNSLLEQIGGRLTYKALIT